MGTVENYPEAMTGTLSKRAFRRQVDRIGFDAAARQYEKWMEEAESSRRLAQRTRVALGNSENHFTKRQ